MFDPGQPGAAPLPSAGAAPAPGSVADAVAMAEAALAYLASADLASVPASTQAECLLGLARAESLHVAARSAAITAFDAIRGYEADGQYSPRTWLQWQTRSTRHASVVAVGWARRLTAHPAVRDALATGEISPSWAQQICAWTDRLPEEARGRADEVLLSEAARGAGLDRLSGLAEEIFRLTAPPDTDDPRGFTDRSLALDITFGGASRMVADLTPEATALAQAILESLGKKTGPEDDRSQPQRNHDAFEEACRRGLAGGNLPDRAGQPTQAQIHVTLDELLDQPGAPSATQAWRAGQAATDRRAGWILDPITAQAWACDAHLTTIVTAHTDRTTVALAVREFLAAANGTDGTTSHPPATRCCVEGCTTDHPTTTDGADPRPVPMTFDELQDLFLRQAIACLSGPTGLAAHLRTAAGGPPPPASASPWTSAPSPPPSPRTCAGPSSPATGTAPSPAATSPPRPAKSTT